MAFGAVLPALLFSFLLLPTLAQQTHSRCSSPQPGSPRTSIAHDFFSYHRWLSLGWARTQYASVVIFGASDCDDAHLRPSKFRHTLRGGPYYYRGRYTNGPVFGEYLGRRTLTGGAITQLNYAYGEATVSNHILHVNAPDAKQQMDLYVADITHGYSKRGKEHKATRVLHCIWIGINDVILVWSRMVSSSGFQSGDQPSMKTQYDQARASLGRVLDAFMDRIQTLTDDEKINVVTSDVLVLLLPPLEIVPNLRYQSLEKAKNNPKLAAIFLHYMGRLTQTYNDSLKRRVEAFASNHQPPLNQASGNFSRFLKVFDTPAFFRQVHQNPSRLNLSNVDEACWNSANGSICPNPEAFEFWDTLHPTTQMHHYIANEITVSVNS